MATLLVTGGQSELRRAVAFAFHETGPLREGPFVYVDCRCDEPRLRAALQGCFSRVAGHGAGSDVVLAAWGGTLYLDHVTELPPSTQKLVMWALERAGRDDTESWPLRFAAGCDRDLESVVQTGAFLPELYDALDKIHVELQAAHVAA